MRGATASFVLAALAFATANARLLGTGNEAIWTTLAPIPLAPRQEHSTVALSDTTLAIVGGVIPNGTSFSTTPLVQLYSIPDNTWRTAAALPTPLNHPNVAVVQGKIYVLGGLADYPNSTWKGIPDSWVYDPSTDSWQSIKPMPAAEARGAAAIGVVGRRIYLSGGLRLTQPIPGGAVETIDSVITYDAAVAEWVPLPGRAMHLPEGRDHAGGAVVGHKVYVVGGRRNGQGNVKDTVFSLDIRALERGWKTERARMPTARGGLSVAAVKGSIYTFGGEGNPAEGTRGIFNQTEVYDVAKGEWTVLAPMEVPRHGTAATTARGVIYIPGGGVAQGGAPVDVFTSFAPPRGLWERFFF